MDIVVNSIVMFRSLYRNNQILENVLLRNVCEPGIHLEFLVPELLSHLPTLQCVAVITFVCVSVYLTIKWV